jgi:hypothetical protein
LQKIGCSVILTSISIPLYGTPLHYKTKSKRRLVDENISHYEGDHVLFKHKHLSENEIYEVYRRVNKIFYSLKNILKRWLRFIRKQTIQESLPQFALKILVTTVIYFKLSIFQRHHAQKGVLNLVRSKKYLVVGRKQNRYYENPLAV